VITDAVTLDKRDEVLRREACERRLGEIRIGREKIVRARQDVGEVAAASAGDGYLLSDALIMLKDERAAPTLARFDSAKEPGSAPANNYDIPLNHFGF